MVEIKLASGRDFAYWMSLDKNMDDTEVRHLICNKRCYIISAAGNKIGIMRYGLYHDNIPFLNWIYLEEASRRRGYGAAAVAGWEQEMQSLGHNCVLTSTREDEMVQAFYKTQGYKTAGYMAEIPCIGSPKEVFFLKELAPQIRVVGR